MVIPLRTTESSSKMGESEPVGADSVLGGAIKTPGAVTWAPGSIVSVPPRRRRPLPLMMCKESLLRDWDMVPPTSVVPEGAKSGWEMELDGVLVK